MTDDELRALERLRELAASPDVGPRPWRWGEGRSEVLCEEGVLDANGDAVSVNCGRGAGDWTEKEAEYAILAANLVPVLLAQNDALRTQVQSHCDRIAAQSELLGRRAEKPA